MSTIYTIWCEYDLGLEEQAWVDYDVAEQTVRKVLTDNGMDYDELDENGLVNIKEMELHE